MKKGIEEWLQRHFDLERRMFPDLFNMQMLSFNFISQMHEQFQTVETMTPLEEKLFDACNSYFLALDELRGNAEGDGIMQKSPLILV